MASLASSEYRNGSDSLYLISDIIISNAARSRAAEPNILISPEHTLHYYHYVPYKMFNN